MATDDEALRSHLIDEAIRNVPRAFLERFLARVPNAYREKFLEVDSDPTTIEDQRLARLCQDRVFRLDWELAQAAKEAKLPATSRPLPENGWAYTYVAAGSVGITQSYVQTIGALPKPAKFRDGLAKAAAVPRLAIDEPAEIYLPKSFYALIAHNPLGKKFRLPDQDLGSVQFCVPCHDMKAWALEISVTELLSYYPSIKRSISTRSPAWKKRPDTGTEPQQ